MHSHNCLLYHTDVSKYSEHAAVTAVVDEVCWLCDSVRHSSFGRLLVIICRSLFVFPVEYPFVFTFNVATYVSTSRRSFPLATLKTHRYKSLHGLNEVSI